MNILKAVTAGLTSNQNKLTAKAKKEAAKEIKQLKDGESATVLESDDDIEVFEVTDDDVSITSSSADTSGIKQKLRPNDKVSIKYTDGRVETDVKWKKVKAAVEAGEAEIV